MQVAGNYSILGRGPAYNYKPNMPNTSYHAVPSENKQKKGCNQIMCWCDKLRKLVTPVPSVKRLVWSQQNIFTQHSVAPQARQDVSQKQRLKRVDESNGRS